MENNHTISQFGSQLKNVFGEQETELAQGLTTFCRTIKYAAVPKLAFYHEYYHIKILRLLFSEYIEIYSVLSEYEEILC